MKSVLKRLRNDYAKGGKGAAFHVLETCLIGSRDTQPYAALSLGERARRALPQLRAQGWPDREATFRTCSAFFLNLFEKFPGSAPG